jgi:formiminotetrahydrofolate cyclodeaminase
LAAEAGVEVAGSELVGLMPRASAVATSGDLLRLIGAPLGDRLLEDRLADRLPDPAGALPRYAAQIESTGHLDPGGGSAVALSLLLGRACLVKAIDLSRDGRGKLTNSELDDLMARLPSAGRLVEEAREDHHAFAELMTAWKLPKGPTRKDALRAARVPAVYVPENVFEQAVEVAEVAAAIAEGGNTNLVNDAVAAAELALAAGRVARLNARANQKKKDRRGYSTLLGRLEDAAKRARDSV